MIKFVVFDFDGVFTDGKFYFNKNETSSKCYNGKDAYSLKLLKENKIPCGIITQDKIISIENAAHIFNRLDKYSIGEDRKKIEILNEWLNELNLTYKDVAYIGDDLPDIEILEKVAFSACPNDSIEKVKSVCKYICTKNGGEGAVREFVEKVLEQNNQNSNNNVCFCIPARYNSTRLNKKLLLPLGNNTCIQKTILQVVKSKYFNNNIFVFTDSEDIKTNLENYDCNIIMTDGEYKNGSDRISKNLNQIDTKYNIIVNVQADEPFISPVNIDFCIDKHIENIKEECFYTTLHEIENSDEYLNSTASLKVVLNNNNDVLYYSRNLIPANKVGAVNSNIKYNTFTGIYVYNRPSILQYSQMENTFLQNEEDCEQLKVLENGFKIKSYQTKEYNEVSLNTDLDYEYLLDKFYKTFKKSYVLDCTLRDGGYINNWRFNTNFIEKYIEIMNKSTVDMVEIGFLNKSNNYKGVPTGVMRTIDEEYLKLYENSRFKICALADYVDINMDLLKKGIKIDLIRIAFHKKDMVNALKKCKEIQDLGYNISINAMAVTNYTDEELNVLIDLVNENQFFLLYIADSYGSLNQKDLERYLNLFNKKLTKTSVGIHLHNNMNNAFSNYEYTSKLIFEKDIYIDTTLFGMGRGAGNLQTELVLHHRQENIKVLMDIFEFINMYIKENYNLNKNNWGYDLDFLISGIFKIHPNYIDKFREINITFSNLVYLINIILEDKKENYYDNEYINNLIKKYNDLLL